MDLNGTVTPESLYAAGALSRSERPLKILGDGEITSALHIRAHKFSESAKSKIEAAGGTAEVIA
jgi:large subunit ribosomal protein L15